MAGPFSGSKVSPLKNSVETLNLSVGDRQIIRLTGRGTAGYAWTAQVDDSRIASVSSAGTAAREAPPGSPAPGFSASRDELFEVLGLAPGSTTIHFSLSRPWEKNKPPIACCDYAVIVS